MKVLEMLDAIEPNEGGDVNLEFNLEHVRNLQSRLQDLEGIIIQNAISTNDQLHNGGHLFKLFQRAEVYFSTECLICSKFIFYFKLYVINFR